ILLMDRYSFKFKIFQAVGKLSISNYLFQSIVSTILFYSYGFGLYNKVSVETGLMIAVVFFIIQAFISMIWIQKYEYGPIEGIWRAFSYWRKPIWKKNR
ncbi:MAG TPA: DUF418 domain-containing protein, partial [Pseudoneobacillus sp.]|nr:DUF418 domain-containing protein [Pseudoneobacillus sp.]